MCSSFQQPKKAACDGRCQGNGCKSKKPSQLVVVASGGHICLLEKKGQALTVHPNSGELSQSPQAFGSYLQSTVNDLFDQLVLVGSHNDLAWLGALLPTELGTRVVAEMNYPLRSEWLHEPSRGQLIAALHPLMQ